MEKKNEVHDNRRILEQRITLWKGFSVRLADIIAFLGITLLAVLVRYALIGAVSPDYTYYLEPWARQIESNPGGPLMSLGKSIGNYTPLYMYFFTLAQYLPIGKLEAVKLITLVFDFIAAFFFLYYAGKRTGSIPKGLLAYGVVLFLPSVLINGALWGQCDIIFTFFMVLSFLWIMKGKPAGGMIFYGIAFALKLQAVFFLPVLLVLWLHKKMKLWTFLLVPGVYLVSVVPALLFGRSLEDVLSVYLRQTSAYSANLSMDFPNIYQITGDRFIGQMGTAAVISTVALLAVMAYYLYCNRSINWNADRYLLLALFVLLLVPYFLPYMHDRYTFPADIFALLLFFRNKRYFWTVIATQLLSVLSYQRFLFQQEGIPYSWAAVAYLLFLCFLAYRLVRPEKAKAHSLLEKSL